MEVLIDDVGSFPLPSITSRETFSEAYILAREAILEGRDLKKDDFLKNNFYKIVVESLKMKWDTGLDIVTYPQHYDMHRQFTDVIHKAMDQGSYIVDQKEAILPELYVIKEESKALYEYKGDRLPLKICVTGPMELYLKEIGTTCYPDVLMMFAETVRLFAKNSILNSKYVQTEVISLDEPSFGFQDINTDRDTIMDVLEKALDFGGVTTQIHLHSPLKIKEILDTQGLDVFSLEYAASPSHLEVVSKRSLEKADKQVRVGVSRTDIDTITAELHDKGILNPTSEQLVENEKIIKKRFRNAQEKYENTLAFTGPDCGLGGWPTQHAAQHILKKTVAAVRSVEKREK